MLKDGLQLQKFVVWTAFRRPRNGSRAVESLLRPFGKESQEDCRSYRCCRVCLGGPAGLGFFAFDQRRYTPRTLNTSPIRMASKQITSLTYRTQSQIFLPKFYPSRRPTRIVWRRIHQPIESNGLRLGQRRFSIALQSCEGCFGCKVSGPAFSVAVTLSNWFTINCPRNWWEIIQRSM
jgi:hypothetical protein